jgi:thiamine biosynthesis lipoprotein
LVRKRPFFLVLFLSLLFGCAPKEKWHTATFLYFDTICEMNILCHSHQFESCQEEVHRVFTEIETRFSPGSADYCSHLVLDLFKEAFQVYRDSEGFFDITVAPLSRLWGFIDKQYRLPKPEEIEEVLKSVGMDKIKIENDCLILPPHMELDWGGIAKGLGIDLASMALKKMGIAQGFLNSGGDLFCWGKNPARNLWKIGIAHPREKGYLGVLSLTELAAATTGDYQRSFEIDNVRYHHVFNPHTGYPSQNKQSVTVVGPKALYCDALSTALFANPHPEKIIEKHPEYGAVIVDSRGKVFMIGKLYSFNLIKARSSSASKRR